MYINKFNTHRIIWILEDDANDRFVYERILGPRYQLEFLETLSLFREKLDQCEIAEPHLIIADLRLQDGHFLNFLIEERQLQEKCSKYIVVSSYSDLDLLRACFEQGALDYLTKPFDKNELIVKVERLLERHCYHSDTTHFQNTAVRELFLSTPQNSIPLKNLTLKEEKIFKCLLKGMGNPIERNQILGEVWGDTSVGQKTLDVHLFRLRKKLTGTGFSIEFQRPNAYILSKDRMNL